MEKTKLGVLLGIIAGIVDVLPMLAQHLTWDANLSAFSFWVVSGFFIAVTDIKLKGLIKGVSISLIILLPSAILIGWNSPFTLVPIVTMTLVLGSLLGFLVEKYGS
jgi:hypothetical protein